MSLPKPEPEPSCSHGGAATPHSSLSPALPQPLLDFPSLFFPTFWPFPHSRCSCSTLHHQNEEGLRIPWEFPSSLDPKKGTNIPGIFLGKEFRDFFPGFFLVAHSPCPGGIHPSQSIPSQSCAHKSSFTGILHLPIPFPDPSASQDEAAAMGEGRNGWKMLLTTLKATWHPRIFPGNKFGILQKSIKSC